MFQIVYKMQRSVLKNALFQVEIDEKSRKYMAFVTHEEECEFLKHPFGLRTSRTQFQRYGNTVFRKLLRDCSVVIYVEDFLFHPKTRKKS